MTKKVKYFYDDVYDIGVYVFRGSSYKFVETWLQKKGVNTEEIDFEDDNAAGFTLGVFQVSNENFMVVYFESRINPSNIEDITRVIAHEAHHIFLSIYEFVGAEVDLLNQEPHTYYYCSIFKKVIDALYKFN